MISVRFTIKRKMIFVFITLLCVVSGCLYTIHSFAPTYVPFLKPDSLQFIIPTAGDHNHLGDLLGIGLIALSISIVPFMAQFVLAAYYLPLMFISFSKSAFLSIIITFFSIALVKRGKFAFLFLCIAGFAVLSVIIYTKEFSSFKPVAKLQSYVEKYIHLKPKTLLSARDLYIAQASQSWTTTSLEHSFFGFGPGNFIYASSKSARNSGYAVTDPHNITLTYIMESGLLAAFWFLVFFILTIFIGKKTNNALSFLILYLFINFQTDYTYLIPLFFALFFFLSGQIIAPLVDKRQKTPLHLLIAAMIIITLCFGSYSFYLDETYGKFSLRLNQSFLTMKATEFNSVSRKLEEITPYDETLLISLSTYSERRGNMKEAIRLLEKLSIYSPRNYLSLLTHQLALQKKNNIDIKKYLGGRRGEFSRFPFTKEEKDQLNKICSAYTKTKCVE